VTTRAAKEFRHSPRSGENDEMNSDATKADHLRIVSRELTTCGGTDGGRTIVLNFIENSGASISIELPLRQAASLAMTLPRLLSSAVKLQTGDPHARYVFSVGKWTLESSEGSSQRILTMQTPDGFAVSFAVPFSMCDEMGETLASHHGMDATSQPRRRVN
jgi:hypothetical protein